MLWRKLFSNKKKSFKKQNFSFNFQRSIDKQFNEDDFVAKEYLIMKNAIDSLLLYILSNLLQKSKEYNDLVRKISLKKSAIITGLTSPAKSMLVSLLFYKLQKPILVITQTQEKARTFWQDCFGFLPPENLFLFLDREHWPNEDPWINGERVSILSRILQGEKLLLVASIRSALRYTIPQKLLKDNLLKLMKGDSYKWEPLLEMLTHLGYVRTRIVDSPGAFSVRGGVLDIFPSGCQMPVRLEWLGEELESIRYFDPVSQRTVGYTDSCSIFPVREYIWDKERVENSWKSISSFPMNDDLYSRLKGSWEVFKTGILPSEFEYIYPFYYPEESTLFDYFRYSYSDFLLIEDVAERLIEDVAERLIEDETKKWEVQLKSLKEELLDLKSSYLKRNEIPDILYFPYSSISLQKETFVNINKLIFQDIVLEPQNQDSLNNDNNKDNHQANYQNNRQDKIISIDSFSARSFARKFPDFLTAILKDINEKENILIFTTQGSRLNHLLSQEGITVKILKPASGELECALINKYDIINNLPQIILVPLPLSQGFSIPSISLKVWTDLEILGKVIIPHSHPRAYPKEKTRRFKGKPITLEDLSSGDFVVHTTYGIAKFLGLVSMMVSGAVKGMAGGTIEFLQLQFTNNDMVYVPIYNMELVEKYISSEGHIPTLSRLGGKEWNNKKKKVAKAAEEIARDLLKVEAIRKEHPGHSFSPDTEWQKELEDSFPFEETPDQNKAIHEVKEDMENTVPMDRLILGDAGYGKTEVALRAAFKAVMDSKQAALLAPTTILAQQHFITFSERLSTFPVTIELFSRFKSTKEQKKALEDLTKGKIDIAIGTHRLLQKDVTFSDLGILIIDEEQRFGVKHKERLKKFKETVDVLTLSATPIPRTLHMAITGVRDLSIIETPPEDRLPVKTYVSVADPPLIKQAILRELDRGGQIYFLHNRIETINKMAQMLFQLIPKARIAVAHGQIAVRDLESIMDLFTKGFYDILVCTTIIENGLDILNVNTLIVNDAHLLGLSQLYQIRGRVGRSHTQAYAYFLFPPKKKLTEDAQKRLDTIKDFTNFGAGYQIAMRDLEIRGAGDLLGMKQHGHIGAVGFYLYCQLLDEAIKSLKGIYTISSSFSVQMNLPIQAFIPDFYIDDKLLKMSAYRKLSRVKDEGEILPIKEELIDRFGPLPLEVENLFSLVALKLLAQSRRIHCISLSSNCDDRVFSTLPDGYNYAYANNSSIRITIEWKGKRRFMTPPPSLPEFCSGEDYLAFNFTGNISDGAKFMLSTIMEIISAMEII